MIPGVVLQTIIENASDETLGKILEDTDFDEDVCRAIAEILEFEKKDDEEVSEIFNILEDNSDMKHFLPYLGLEERDWEELIVILDCADFDEELCEKMIPYFKLGEKTQKELVRILDESDYDEDIKSAVQDHLRLNLLSWEKLLDVLEHIDLEEVDSNFYDEYISPALRLAERSQDELDQLLEAGDYGDKICDRVEPYYYTEFKSTEEIKQLQEKISSDTMLWEKCEKALGLKKQDN